MDGHGRMLPDDELTETQLAAKKRWPRAGRCVLCGPVKFASSHMRTGPGHTWTHLDHAGWDALAADLGHRRSKKAPSQADTRLPSDSAPMDEVADESDDQTGSRGRQMTRPKQRISGGPARAASFRCPEENAEGTEGHADVQSRAPCTAGSDKSAKEHKRKKADVKVLDDAAALLQSFQDGAGTLESYVDAQKRSKDWEQAAGRLRSHGRKVGNVKELPQSTANRQLSTHTHTHEFWGRSNRTPSIMKRPSAKQTSSIMKRPSAKQTSPECQADVFQQRSAWYLDRAASDCIREAVDGSD